MLTTSPAPERRRRAYSASIPVNPHRLTGRGEPLRCGSPVYQTGKPAHQYCHPASSWTGSTCVTFSTDYGYQWVTLRVVSDDTRASETLQVSWDDDGFTLIDLLLVIVIVIVIVGIISVPLANVVLGYLRGTDATTARLPN
jgi:type II secretory pathway pseudopilin PulG